MSDIVERLRSGNPGIDSTYPKIMAEAADELIALRAEVERLRAALEAICMMDISWVGDAFKLKDIARAALEGK